MFGITREKNDKFRSCCKYILVVKWRLRQDCEIFLMRNRDLLLVIYLLFLTFANNWPRIPDLSSHAALCSALREGIAAIYSPTEKQGSCRTSKNIYKLRTFNLILNFVSDFSMVLLTGTFTLWCVSSYVLSKLSAPQHWQLPVSQSWPTRFRTTWQLCLWVGNRVAAATFWIRPLGDRSSGRILAPVVRAVFIRNTVA
jgi:hypothetical protein